MNDTLDTAQIDVLLEALSDVASPTEEVFQEMETAIVESRPPPLLRRLLRLLRVRY